jgi:hypothetical protein
MRAACLDKSDTLTPKPGPQQRAPAPLGSSEQPTRLEREQAEGRRSVWRWPRVKSKAALRR